MRSQPIVARKIHRDRAIARRFKANIRIDVAKREAPLRIEDEAELRRQSAQILVLREPRLQRREARSEIEQGFRIEVVQRTCYDVPQALDFGVRVDELYVLKARMQVGKRALAQASQMEISAGCKADDSVAAGKRGVRQRSSLIERQAPSWGAHTRKQSVTGLHRREAPGHQPFR